MNNILWIVQARSRNTRLPGKNFKKIGDKTILEHHLSNIWYLDATIVIATPYDEPKLSRYKKIAKKYDVLVRNPKCLEQDVLRRFVEVANEFNPDWIVRTTADCWKMDKEWCRKTIDFAVKNNMPIFNTYKEESVIEVFKYSDILRADLECYDMNQREHVTAYFRKGFKKGSIDERKELENARREFKELVN